MAKIQRASAASTMPKTARQSAPKAAPQTVAPSIAQTATQTALANPALQSALQRVVVAGKTIMYSPQTRHLLQQGLMGKGDPADILATQIAGILKMMDDKSGMNIPKQVMVPAGLVLMQDLVKFVEQTKIFKVTIPDVKQAIQKMIQFLLREYQLYDQQVARAHAAGAQAAQSPQSSQAPPVQPPVPGAPPAAAAPTGILAQAGGR